MVLIHPQARISIHALRKESDPEDALLTAFDGISIHALREESDRPPIRRSIRLMISIHALRKESDMAFFRCAMGISKFQSTLSVRRATGGGAEHGICLGISIHALRKESDTDYWGAYPAGKEFQSTLSVRRATGMCCVPLSAERFQSTLSVRRATKSQRHLYRPMVISIHALRKESDYGSRRTLPPS